MKKVHFFLQSKGGVGKSLLASLLAQYYLDQEIPVLAIDTDPVNKSWEGYDDLNVRRLDILTEDDDIDPRKFDDLIELINDSDCDVIIDNGASSFVALSYYLLTSDIFGLLKSLDIDIYVHCVLTGGHAADDTLLSLNYLLNETDLKDYSKFIVWLNPFWGEVHFRNVPFHETELYLNNNADIFSMIHMPKLKESTFGRDFQETLAAKKTLQQAIVSTDTKLVQKQRLKQIRNEIFAQIQYANVVG